MKELETKIQIGTTTPPTQVVSLIRRDVSAEDWQTLEEAFEKGTGGVVLKTEYGLWPFLITSMTDDLYILTSKGGPQRPSGSAQTS